MHERMVKLILALPQRRPAPALPARLDELFRQLADESLGPRAAEVEDLIWTLWMHHPMRPARARLEEAVAALSAHRYGEAEMLLDGLVAAHPDFAEAWNKRATLHFLLQRDADSAADIVQVLELEPRHFGALCGFGQICERRGDPAGALTAYEAALRINPHLRGVRRQAERLQRRFRTMLH